MKLHVLSAFALTTLLAVSNTRAADAPAAPDSGKVTAATTAPAGSSTIENSVVKIFASLRSPDPYKPWTKRAPRDISGTGVVIPGNRILTNAHMVLYASQIQVQANQSGDKIPAVVEAVAPGIDLAVIRLTDETFFKTHLPLPFSDGLPQIKDSVLVYGFPEGGNNLSITKGIVSRIEFASYNLFTSGLRIQIDAAINPGNSGGPAIIGDKMMGLAFSRLGGADNIGYIIPIEEVNLFLKDEAKGHYDGKPALYDDLQTLQNPALRPYLKIAPDVHGIIIDEPYDSAPSYPLKKWDIVSKIGDSPVDDEGMITLGNNLRVRFDYLVQNIAKDGKVPLTVVREGKQIPVEVPVSSDRPLLIPALAGDYPSYFIYGPMTFSEATMQFVQGIGGGDNSDMSFIGSPLVTRRGDKPAFPGERLVVVSSPFFPDNIANNYSNPQTWVIKSVNGIKVKNLANLVEILRDSKDDSLVFEFAGQGLETFVFNRKALQDSTENILNDNGVRAQGSPDTMKVWNAKAGN